jgi:hypothetical protein
VLGVGLTERLGVVVGVRPIPDLAGSVTEAAGVLREGFWVVPLGVPISVRRPVVGV